MIKKFINYYKPYRGLFCIDLIAASFAAIIDLIYPLVTREIINVVIPNKQFNILMILGVVLLVIYLLKSICNYVMDYYGHIVGVKIQADMRKDMFEHLQKLPSKYFDNNKTGDLMSRMVNDLNEISELAHHGPEDLFISIFMLCGSFLVLSSINLSLTLIVFAFIPIIVLVTWSSRKKMKNAFRLTREKTSLINSTIENSIAGIKVTKAYVTHDYDNKRFAKSNSAFYEARKAAYHVMAKYFVNINLSLDLLDYVVLILGGLYTMNGFINIGDYLTFVLYIKLFTQPIKKLIMFMEQYQHGMSGFKRYIELYDEDIEKDKTDAETLAAISGKIAFSNVTFAYEDKKILDNLSFTINPGEMIALVGPSGGGKTTICNLIPRFYEINDGSISLDEHNITDLKLHWLRSQIGVVSQEVYLFSGTILDNIKYGNINATQEEIIAAAKKANIHDFILDLEDGYDTYIGERGVKLSGGQKQRISIARVFLKNPKILILDEATSALDNHTEYLIQSALDELRQGRTTIVVAHRLSTIKNADKILVIKGGKIIEAGSHEELLANKQEYYDLHKFTTKNQLVIS